jgi:hypothetical protein
MGPSRRNLLAGALSIVSRSAARAWIPGSNPAPARILIIGYGQSNMGSLFVNADANVPAAVPNTFFYDGSTITTVPAANGIRQLQNSLTAATGLPTVSINATVIGSPISAFVSGNSVFTSAVNQVNAIIQPTDKVFIIWDQGEGDADNAPPELPEYYAPLIGQIHGQLVAAIGRTKANCQFLTAGLGTSSLAGGTVTGGQTDRSWQTIKNSNYNSSLQNPFVYFSHTNMDLGRAPGDTYHYDAANQQKQGARFAQSIATLMGVASPSGLANWSISNGATVDATHTNINVVQNLGTDFTPTSGGNGWEVSGDNGATWATATASRNSATQISLVHPSITTTSARLVRYLYGAMPPNSSGSNPPTAMIFDTSALQIPLSPTRWDIRPTPISVLPVPTWRDIDATNSGSSQTIPYLALGPDTTQCKFIIFSLSGTDFGFNPILDIKITPKDHLGNNVGAAVHPSTTAIISQGSASGGVSLYSALLGTDANAATSFQLDLTLTSASGNTLVNVWTVPFADLNSTTPTGSNKSSTPASVSGTTTVNVSAGGFILAVADNSIVPYSGAAFATVAGSESYAMRWEGTGIHAVSADAANASANASSSVTVTFSSTTFTGNSSGTTNLTVSVVTGTIHSGDTIVGAGIPGGTQIVSQTSGTTGGAGVYVTNNPTSLTNVAITVVGTVDMVAVAFR